jgi:diguanylate cyclase (GGDEF)-like protein
MHLPDTQYFLLVYPICLILIGAAFVAAHLWFKAPKYLLWMGLGCILPSAALCVQTLMTNAQLRRVAPWFALFYLGGACAVAHGMFLKANSKINIFLTSFIITTGMVLLLYFTHIDDNLWIRIIIINIAILCLESLAIPTVYLLLKKTYSLEKLLCFSYFSLFIYGFIRTLIVIIYLQNVQNVDLAVTTWWMMMIAINLVISLLFIILISAVAIKEKFNIINEERLRDSLTNLYNRSGFLEKTEEFFNKLQLDEVYLVMCDIDNFKNINDTWGHVAGDSILCTIADICNSNIRKTDIIGRFGGEEFILLLQSLDNESSFTLVDRLRKKIEDQIFINNIRITASFGIAKITEISQLDSALELADKRLYNAKNSGRNQVCFN